MKRTLKRPGRVTRGGRALRIHRRPFRVAQSMGKPETSAWRRLRRRKSFQDVRLDVSVSVTRSGRTRADAE